MKQSILFLFLFCLVELSAKESVLANVVCSKTSVAELHVKITNRTLNLSEDAVQDNLGGYVDIPDENYYLKTDTSVYHLNGVVEYNYKNNTQQFISHVSSGSNKYISIDKLHSLKDNSNLKLIQKINLENKTKDTITTNILNIHFDKDLFEKEYKKCKSKH